MLTEKTGKYGKLWSQIVESTHKRKIPHITLKI